jgi:hypothetical protein
MVKVARKPKPKSAISEGETARKRVHEKYAIVFDCIARCYSDWLDCEKPSGLRAIIGDLRTAEALESDRADFDVEERKRHLGRASSRMTQLALAMVQPERQHRVEPKQRRNLTLRGIKIGDMLEIQDKEQILRNIDGRRREGITMSDLLLNCAFRENETEKLADTKRWVKLLHRENMLRTEGSHRGLRYFPYQGFQEIYDKAMDGDCLGI